MRAGRDYHRTAKCRVCDTRVYILYRTTERQPLWGHYFDLIDEESGSAAWQEHIHETVTA